MSYLRDVCAILVLSAVVAGCGGGATQQSMNKMGSMTSEPNFVTVQHVLVAFEGTVDNVTRSKTEAEQLALDIYNRAKANEDFDALMETYSDDTGGGIYGMANDGQEADKARLIYPRSDMAASFGDVAFSLNVGEVGMATYDEKKCKYGWHVIKRIR